MLSAPAANAAGNIGVCHRTGGDRHPYVFQRVAANSTALQAHGDHQTLDKTKNPGEDKFWKSDGVWNGIAHVKGGFKPDYIMGDPNPPAGMPTDIDLFRTWCLKGLDSGGDGQDPTTVYLVVPGYEANDDCAVPGWVTEPASTGINYTIDGGEGWTGITTGTHEITATLIDPVNTQFQTSLPDGWSLGTIAGTAVYSVDLKSATDPCQAPVGTIGDVGVTEVDGCGTYGSITPPANPVNVVYSIQGGSWTQLSGSYVVTATLTNGAASFTSIPTGWSPTSPTTATRTVNVGLHTACSNPTEVTPLEPSWVEAKCASDPRVDYTAVQGVSYATTGTVAPGQTVTVTASALRNYKLKSGVASSWGHTFRAKPSGAACDNGGGPITPEPEPEPGLTLVKPKYPKTTDPDCSHRGQLIVPPQPAGVLMTRSGTVPGDVTFTFAPADGYAFPEGTDAEVTVKVAKKLSGEDCILGEETTKPKPHGTKSPKPRDRAPIVLGTQAAVPTAVDAGLAGLPSASISPISSPRLAQALVAGGLLLLIAGGSMGLGRRTRGAHES